MFLLVWHAVSSDKNTAQLRLRKGRPRPGSFLSLTPAGSCLCLNSLSMCAAGPAGTAPRVGGPLFLPFPLPGTLFSRVFEWLAPLQGARPNRPIAHHSHHHFHCSSTSSEWCCLSNHSLDLRPPRSPLGSQHPAQIRCHSRQAIWTI